MISKEQLKKIIKEETKRVLKEADEEGRMAKSQLMDLVQNAQQLLNQIQDGDELPSWLQANITRASDYIAAATRSNNYENEVEGNISTDYTDSGDNVALIDRVRQLYRDWQPPPKEEYAVEYKEDLGKVIEEFEKNQNLQEVAPPGREEQVKALKGKVENPYAVAWTSYKKAKKKK